VKRWLQTLWAQERPSRARARRKLAVDDALWELRQWADYGDSARLAAAVAILQEAGRES
jgi:hypothetical protein